MPERSLTIAAYAAGASLAAATLVYVFGPTIFLSEAESRNERKRTAVGLSNPGNDCFINSVVQALAGLPTLRLYLIRELHQRTTGGEDVYLDLGQLEEDSTIEKGRPEWLQVSLQIGVLSVALKTMLDALNERPIARKTISAVPFISAVERAFKTRVSRNQQDAQEFLQLILERLADEHLAGVKARKRAKDRQRNIDTAVANLNINDPDADDKSTILENTIDGQESTKVGEMQSINDNSTTEGSTFELPFSGKLSSIVECSVCQFQPKHATTAFLTLSLHVPHECSSTTLGACLDGLLKAEQIEDFKCDRCRLEHALQIVNRHLERTSLSEKQLEKLDKTKIQLQRTIDTDPEHPPSELQLPDISLAPKRRITRYMRISSFPQVLAIHLSRSVWAASSASSKNLAKVSFTEILQLGSLVERKSYRLMSIVCHRGSHNSGHYETFRRQWSSPQVPPASDAIASPEQAEISRKETPDPSTAGSGTELESITPAPGIIDEAVVESKTPEGAEVQPDFAQSLKEKATTKAKSVNKQHRALDRWWRISDDKVKECKISDVLGMQRDVYLLFYELIPS